MQQPRLINVVVPCESFYAHAMHARVPAVMFRAQRDCIVMARLLRHAGVLARMMDLSRRARRALQVAKHTSDSRQLIEMLPLILGHLRSPAANRMPATHPSCHADLYTSWLQPWSSSIAADPRNSAMPSSICSRTNSKPAKWSLSPRLVGWLVACGRSLFVLVLRSVSILASPLQ